MKRLALMLTSSAAGLLLAAGAAQAGACSGEIMALQKQLEGTPTMTSNAAPNGSGEAGSTPGTHEMPLPAARGGTLVQGGSTTAPPVESQPMDSDAAQATQLNTPAGTDSGGISATGVDAAAEALARARALDQAGDEAGCLNAVNEAKSQLGAQ
jgi:hypothetical protein